MALATSPSMRPCVGNRRAAVGSNVETMLWVSSTLLTTAVGGLQAQSFALQNISGNIANASTTGYKGIDTSFEDLIPDSLTPNRQVAGGVTAFAQATITTQGTVSATTVATNMAINGDGFFTVQKPTGIVDNMPTFTGVTDYTRARRFPGQCQRQSGQRRRLLPDGRGGRSEDRQPARQRSAGAAVPEQLHSGAGHHRDQYAANLPTTPTTARPAPTSTPGTDHRRRRPQSPRFQRQQSRADRHAGARLSATIR